MYFLRISFLISRHSSKLLLDFRFVREICLKWSLRQAQRPDNEPVEVTLSESSVITYKLP
jgi:hypothetical protein